jgi:hypothetical protein
MEEIYIPRDFINSIQNWDDRFKQLQDGNEWLEGIDKDLTDADLVILRDAFLTDGHKFMITLIEFLNAVKWQEFVAHICTHSVAHMPVLMHLLYRGLCDSLRDDVTEPASQPFAEAFKGFKGSGLLDRSCIEAIRNRYCNSASPR